MTVANATKKLVKSGFEVIGTGVRFSGRKGNQVIEFARLSSDSDSIGCIRVRSVDDMDNTMADYSAGVWCNNISQAIRLSAS